VALHADEPPIDAALVERLVAAQFPQYADLPVVPFESSGTTNAIYRLGSRLMARLPRRASGVDELHKSFAWLPKLARRLPAEIPVPVAQGAPGEGYPWPWSLVEWLDGEHLEGRDLPDPVRAAHDLAGFLAAFQSLDASGGPLATTLGLRSAPLADRDRQMRRSIASLPGDIDQRAVLAVWSDALRLPAWDRAPVWSHGDLMPGNLLWRAGRLEAVIDFGSLAVGDPACDLMVAWSLFEGTAGREAFRHALREAFPDGSRADESLWLRGRAHALAQAVIYIPYYLHTRPQGVAAARRVIAGILADAAADPHRPATRRA
jgi:aminoglycoside phosphotransferase (APT) family kinase protein